MMSCSPGCPTFAENKATPEFLPPYADWLQPREQAALRNGGQSKYTQALAERHPTQGFQQSMSMS